MKGKPTAWPNEAIEYLKKHFPHQWNKELAKYFNVGWRTIVRKARELGLEKAPDFRYKIDFTLFNKGVSPPNKGKMAKDYMTPEGLEKMKFNQYKKGNVPATQTNPEVCVKIWNTRKTRNKEKLLQSFEIESANKIKVYNDRLSNLKETFKTV